MRSLAFWVCMAAAIIGATHTLWAVPYVVVGLAASLYVAVIVATNKRDRDKALWRRTMLSMRADKQHQQYMKGDPAGTHGEYPPSI